MKLPRRRFTNFTTRLLGVKKQTRLTRLAVVGVVIFGLLLPYLNTIYTAWHYGLDDKTKALVGTTSMALRKQFTFDAEHSQWQFNQKGIEAAQTKPQASENTKGPDPAAALALQKAQLGGTNDEKTAGSLYSVNLPTEGKKGITYYDNNTNLSFDLVPQFNVEDGKSVDGHLVYPFGGGGKLVYSAKNNGMKEDIILSKPMGDSLTFAYKLKLPDTLTAKLLDDGSLGIYSADPTLFGISSFGSDSDVEKVRNAQKTAPKTHLLFALPAPIIKQTGGGQGDSSAHFSLEGDTLSVSASGLENLHYPLTIDPSVVVTSSSDFSAGNNEDNIDFSSNQLNRGNVTGASIGAWHYTHNSTDDGTTYSAGFGSAGSARLEHGTAVYNGYIYITGGWTGSGAPFTDTLYAPINSDGTIGTWTAASYNLAAGHYGHETVAYNGYLYVIGGQTQFYTDNGVFYAPIASGGGLGGAWQSTTGSTYGLRDFAAVVYNGYLYKIGGTNGTRSNTVQYALLNADGTISSGGWTNASTYPQALESSRAVVYNDRIFVTGGYSGSSYTTYTASAKINSDGSLGSWQTNTSLGTGRSNHSSVVYNGYIYVIGGDSGTMLTSVEYAPIYGSGTIGAWKTSSAFSTGFKQHTSVAYNGYIYTLGGYMGTYRDYVQFAKIDVAGVAGTSTTSANTFPSVSSKGKTYTGRQGTTSVAYNGYLYVLGGLGTTGGVDYYFNNVIYAPINSDGSIGAWATTTSFTNGRYAATAVVYNNYMYIMGGDDASTYYSDVQYAPIDASGTLGAWATTTSFTTGRRYHSAVAYKGYMYIMGGSSSTADISDVQYSAIGSTGTLGTWTATASMSTPHSGGGAVVADGRIYVVGGFSADATSYASVNSDGSLSAWSTTTAVGVYQGSVASYRNYIYVVGGNGAASVTQFAKVNSDGTLSSWASITNLNAGRIMANAVIYDGYIYGIAGRDAVGTLNSNIEYAPIRNDGSGVVDNWTTNPNSFTTGRYGQGTVAYNGYLYIMGGINAAGALIDIQYAPINDNGLVGAWSTTTNLPSLEKRGVFGAVAYNGYMYIVGGAGGGGIYWSDVAHVAINGDGTLGTSWTTDTLADLGSGRAGNKVFVSNGYLYTLGGYDATNEYADVRYASINTTTGAVGAWTSTNTYTGARYNFGCAIFNGYVYVVGGRNDALAKNWGDVQYAPLNSNGTVGTWATTTSYAAPRASQAAFAYNGYLYMTGGFDGSAYYASTQYAPIRSDGTLGTWQTSSTTSVYTNARTVPGFVQYNGFAYVVGGAQGSTYYNDVQYSTIKLMPRIAHYSKRIDLGSAVSLSTITFNGTLSGGASNITYRSAGTDGLWGSAAGISTLSGGGGGACGGGGSTRYVQLRVTIDDSNTPALSTSTNVTDITVNYASGSSHPSPDFRLRGGKSYSSQALQPLDTCGA